MEAIVEDVLYKDAHETMVNSMSDMLGRLSMLAIGGTSVTGSMEPPKCAWLSTTSRKWPCIVSVRALTSRTCLYCSSVFI